MAGAYPGLQDRVLLNYTRIENAHRVCKKTFDFSLFIEVQETLDFFYPAETFKCLNAFMLATAVFEPVQQLYRAAQKLVT